MNINKLTILTGPPSDRSMDNSYVSDFMNMPGAKVLCGSTTADIVAREFGLTVTNMPMAMAVGQTPEYQIDGIDLVTEGAATLTHVYNVLDKPVESLSGISAAEKICLMMHSADEINLMIGKAENIAYEKLAQAFKKAGIKVRKTVVEQISEKLKSKGKRVNERYY